MQVVAYAMAIGGIVVVAIGVRGMLPMVIAYRMANAMVVKLAAAGNVDRAEKLCKAAPRSYLDAVGAAIASARATGSTDVVTLAAASRPAFDAAGAKIAMRWRTHTNLGLVGAMLLVGAFALGWDNTHLPIPLAAGAGIGAIVAAWIAAKRGQVDAALASARSEVLPVIEQALAGPAPVAAPPDVDRAEKARRIKALESAPRDEPAKRDAPATRDSRVEALAAPVAKRATASLRSGSCPLCKHTQIRTMSRTSGFLTYICDGCGYTQEFAEL